MLKRGQENIFKRHNFEDVPAILFPEIYESDRIVLYEVKEKEPGQVPVPPVTEMKR